MAYKVTQSRRKFGTVEGADKCFRKRICHI